MNNDKVQNVSCKQRNSQGVKCCSKTPVKFSTSEMSSKRISVVARSKVWVWGRSRAGIAGSNPAQGLDVCLL